MIEEKGACLKVHSYDAIVWEFLCSDLSPETFALSSILLLEVGIFLVP